MRFWLQRSGLQLRWISSLPPATRIASWPHLQAALLASSPAACLHAVCGPPSSRMSRVAVLRTGDQSSIQIHYELYNEPAPRDSLATTSTGQPTRSTEPVAQPSTGEHMELSSQHTNGQARLHAAMQEPMDSRQPPEQAALLQSQDSSPGSAQSRSGKRQLHKSGQGASRAPVGRIGGASRQWEPGMTAEEAPGKPPPDRPRLLIIAGMGAPGSTGWFSHVAAHFAGLRDAEGQPAASVCCFDNRGVGASNSPRSLAAYSTRRMAGDTIALMDHLGWKKAHVVGMSLGAMIAAKMAAQAPERIASLSLMGYTATGWQMAANMMFAPVTLMKMGFGTRRSRLSAVLPYYFSEAFLQQQTRAHDSQGGGEEAMERPRRQGMLAGRLVAPSRAHSGKSYRDVMLDVSMEGYKSGAVNRFMDAEQPGCGKRGHVWATLFHWMTKREIGVIANAGFPVQAINGRRDPLASLRFVEAAAGRMRCNTIITEASHAGITLETANTVLWALEGAVFGGRVLSTEAQRRSVEATACQAALQNPFFLHRKPKKSVVGFPPPMGSSAKSGDPPPGPSIAAV